MYCVQCGTKNPDDARFCKQCGRPMEPPEPPRTASDGGAAAATPPAPPSTSHVTDPETAFAELLSRAFRHYDREEFEAAREACRDALDLKPDSAEAHALLSSIFEHLGEIDKAIVERERVVELSPHSLADREKLEALRAGIAQVGGRRRIVSPKLPAPTFWDTPWGAAVAAMGAALAVLVVGYLALTYREGKTPREQPQPIANTAPTTGTIPGTANVPPPAFTGSPPQPQTSPPATPAPQQPVSEASRPAAPEPRFPAASNSNVGPLPIRPETPPLEARSRDARAGADGEGFFDPNAPQAGRQGGEGGSAGTPQADRGPGRIEIVVAPPGSGGSNLPSPNTPPSGSTPQMESRNNAAIAQNLQLAGRYREAAQAWERALAGAGDDAPRYHQSAALCYQRIGDKPNARRHYNEAIRLYRERIAAGLDKETAEQGIRACEAGLRLVQ